MSELPVGWAYAALSDLLTDAGIFTDGDWIESKDQDPSGENRLLQLADIGDGKFINKSSRYVNDETFNRLNCTTLKEGDLLIARMPDPLGRACLMPKLPQRCLTVVDVAVFRSGNKNIDQRWLMHTINASPVRSEIWRNSSGTTRKRISRGKLSELRIPVPPTAEQKRIAQKLDALLAQVDALKGRIDAIPTLLKRLRRTAISSELSNQGSDKWDVCSVADLCAVAFDGPFGSKLRSNDYTGTGVRVVRLENIGHLNFIGEKVTYVSPQKGNELSKNQLLEGDILFSSFVDEEIRVCQLPRSKESFINKADCFCLRIDPKLANPKFVMFALSSQDTYRKIRASVHGATRPRINLRFLKSFELRLPPIDQQNEIVHRIEQLFAIADQLETKVTTARNRINALTESLLAKAFHGKLVPQDPNDEPASALLERIHTQHAVAPSQSVAASASRHAREESSNPVVYNMNSAR